MRAEPARTGKYTVLFVTTIATFLIPVMSSAVNVALPYIGTQFSMDVITLGWVSTAYMLASASLLVPFGKLADMYGRRRVFIYGMCVFLVGSTISAVSTSVAMLLASRAVQGVGGAAIFATAMAILTSAFPLEERGKALGINTAAVYLGLSMGPVIGGLLTQYSRWQSIFFMASGLTVIVIVVTFWKLRGEDTEAKKEKFDLPGAIVYSLALVLTMFGVSELPATYAIYLIVAGLAIAGLFFWLEMRSKYPLIDFAMFRGNKGYTFSNLAALVNYSGTWAVSYLLTLYLQYPRKISAEETGFILVTSPAVQAVFSLLFGPLSDRAEPRVLASIGMAITALGIGMLAFVTQTTSIFYIIASLAVLGFGFALFSSPNTNAVMSSAQRQYYGIASATLATMRQIGMMVSMGISWVVFATIMGRVEITKEVYPELVQSVRLAFLISAILCAGAITFSLARGNIHRVTKGH